MKKLLEDAEKALQAQAWTSAANSYDSAIEGMLRPHLKNKYHVNVGYNWRKVPEELRSKGVEVEEGVEKIILDFAELRYIAGRSVGYHAGVAWADEASA
ncbi:MAG: hypothetical protein QXE22_05275, partial [Candidatus Bathyarchaeia archaeon]